jgi:tetratricopeptide (TPR) repeat protein
MQLAPPPVDPILIPPRDSGGFERNDASVPRDRLASCLMLAMRDASAAISEGARWLLDDGGLEAELCLAVGYSENSDWESASGAFERALVLAEEVGDSRLSGILGGAANAALMNGDAALARTHLDRVLADETLNGEARSGALLDRANVHVALGDGAAAQADLLAVQALRPNDSEVWLLSATLARRQGDLDAAGDLIDRALELDRNNAFILLEAGNIAIRNNAYGVARQAWEEALAADPDGQAGQAATRNLARLAALVSTGPTVPVEMPDLPDSENIPAEEADPSG